MISSTYMSPSATSVVGLLFPRGPSAISRFIISIVVGKPVERQSWWAGTHIPKESHEIIFPLIAHRYATTSIIPESMVAWIKATFFRVLPNFILTSFGIAMSIVSFCRSFTVEAPATPGMPSSQGCGIGSSAATTITSTKPTTMSPFIVGEARFNDQSPKSLTYGNFAFSHFDLLYRSVVRAGGEFTVLHRPAYFIRLTSEFQS